jgi:hypothetical protein
MMSRYRFSRQRPKGACLAAGPLMLAVRPGTRRVADADRGRDEPIPGGVGAPLKCEPIQDGSVSHPELLAGGCRREKRLPCPHRNAAIKARQSFLSGWYGVTPL